jgi:general secretion pathway protein I
VLQSVIASTRSNHARRRDRFAPVPRRTTFGRYLGAAAGAVAPRNDGFTLLEVLVAFVVAALALGVLFDASLSGLRLATSTERHGQAIARARSHLAMAVHADPLEPGDWRGDDGGGFAWHLHVAPVATTMMRPVAALARHGSGDVALTLFSVAVWIEWRDVNGRRQVRLATEQIGQATP